MRRPRSPHIYFDIEAPCVLASELRSLAPRRTSGVPPKPPGRPRSGDQRILRSRKVDFGPRTPKVRCVAAGGPRLRGLFHRGRFSQMRLRLACAAALAIACSAIGASPAMADVYRPVDFDPQTTNVPYLAWRGEEVRLVKCEPFLGDIPDPWAQDGSTEFDASWIVEDWSGDSITPSLEPSTVKFIDEQNPNGLYYGKHCVKADFVSQKAGMAMIKLVISDAATGPARQAPVPRRLADPEQGLARRRQRRHLGLRRAGLGRVQLAARARHRDAAAARLLRSLLPGGAGPPTDGCLPGLPDAIQLPAENPGAPAAGQGDTTTWWDDIAMRSPTRRAPCRSTATPVADVGHPRRHERTRGRSRGRQRRRRRGPLAAERLHRPVRPDVVRPDARCATRRSTPSTTASAASAKKGRSRGSGR